MISVKQIPKDHTSDLFEYSASRKDSGAHHLFGVVFLEDEVYMPS